ncbi:DUF6095 family protein [Polaribacter sp. Z022]|uniref:DUF6095 family protein n=1 Tax=Polaribacter sp. Z022 TaxID=2927125 RepID=UPI00202001B8|nr:DUF6095 family protein [Polaribacter sp. Z022]MCL7753044.1 DUF6095 family protein [Polaribacter sp. Z022]
MSTDVNLLSKGLKYLGILVFLFIASPITLTIGFKALKKFNDTPKEFISFIILIIAGLLILFTIYFAFKTFKILLKALFNN